MARVASVDEGVEQEDLLGEHVAARRPRRQTATVPAFLAAVASAVGAATFLCGVGLMLSHRSAPSLLTVRELLASDELADITTDNLMALHRGGALAAPGREHLRKQVARGLMQVDAALQQRHPEAHRQIVALHLSAEQQEAALNVLRKFGDARLVGLSRAITSAASENALASGDDSFLERRLTEVLQSRLGDLTQLNAEMFPDNADALATLANSPPALNSKAAQVESGVLPSAAARRLVALDGVSGGVSAHAQALFESLERQAPEHMPTAPARMLGMFGFTSSAEAKDKREHEKFMTCIKAALPDPAKSLKCIYDNFQHVVKFVKGMVMGKKE